jgi:hypothetical protein
MYAFLCMCMSLLAKGTLYRCISPQGKRTFCMCLSRQTEHCVCVCLSRQKVHCVCVCLSRQTEQCMCMSLQAKGHCVCVCLSLNLIFSSPCVLELKTKESNRLHTLYCNIHISYVNVLYTTYFGHPFWLSTGVYIQLGGFKSHKMQTKYVTRMCDKT